MTITRTLWTACLLGVFAWAPGGVTALAQQPPVDQELARLMTEAEQDADGFMFLRLKTAPVGDTPEATAKNKQEFDKFKTQRITQVRRLLITDQALSEADAVIVKGWFYGHEFRVLTQTSPKDLEQLPTARFELFKQWILQTKHQTNHQMMIDLTLGMMQQIVMNNFHPVVRYNAMLVIGELNEQEVVRFGGAPRLPEPYSAALPFIIDRIENPNSPDPVRVAALVGVIRHLEWEPHRTKDNPIPAGVRTQLIASLLKLAEMKTPPGQRTPEGHQWMRRRAIEGLGLASVTTAQPDVVTAVEKLLKDNTESLQLRFAAALALGRTNIPAGYKIDPSELARTLGTLAVTGIKSEFDRLDKMDKVEAEHREVYEGLAGTGGVPGAIQGGRPYGEGIAGMQPGVMQAEVDPKTYRLDPLRKRLRYDLYCVQTGLGYSGEKAAPAPAEGAAPQRKGALKLANTPAEKKPAEDILAQVNKIAMAIEKNKLDYTLLKTEMKTGLKTLETTVAGFAPAAAAPAAPMPGVAPQPGAPMPNPAVKPPASIDDDLGAAPAKK